MTKLWFEPKKKDGSCNNGLEVVELTGWSQGGKREGEGGGGRGGEGTLM